jgi:hypothetical protein
MQWEDDVWFDEVQPFEYHDPALRADKSKPHLLKGGVKIKHITPKMGTILTGVKMEELSSEAKDEKLWFFGNNLTSCTPGLNFNRTSCHILDH